jgi:hypothetical protein
MVIDRDPTRLARAIECGASDAIELTGEAARDRVLELTDGVGVDVAIEAVGMPETFELCADIVRSGGHVANVGVHGKPVTLHLERLWIKGVTITTGLVDTSSTPRLLDLVSAGKLDPLVFVTHRFPLDQAEKAYDAFGAAPAHSRWFSKAPNTSDRSRSAPSPASEATRPKRRGPVGPALDFAPASLRVVRSGVQCRPRYQAARGSERCRRRTSRHNLTTMPASNI